MKREKGYSPEYFDTLSINSSKGFAHILLIALLVAGLVAAIYMVQQKTNIFPKAYVSGPITPPPGASKYSGLRVAFSPISAAFSFNYSGMSPSDQFMIYLSSTTDIFAGLQTGWHTENPIVVNKLNEWSGYGCGKTIYWQVAKYDGATFKGDKSPIQQATYNCTTPSPTIAPSATPVPVGYYIEELPTGGVDLPVPMSVGNSTVGYGIYALLRNGRGDVITDQSDITYQWTLDYNSGHLTVTPWAGCSNGIKPPCPNDHAYINTSSTSPGFGANIWVIAKRISSGGELARGEFTVNMVANNNYVSIGRVTPGYSQGESYQVGQAVNVNWEAAGTGIKNVRYYNVSYFYYKNGSLTGNFIGTVNPPANSINWIIPQDLVGKNNIRISIMPRIETAGGGGQGYSDYGFSVAGTDSSPAQSAQSVPASKTAPQATPLTGLRSIWERLINLFSGLRK